MVNYNLSVTFGTFLFFAPSSIQQNPVNGSGLTTAQSAWNQPRTCLLKLNSKHSTVMFQPRWARGVKAQDWGPHLWRPRHWPYQMRQDRMFKFWDETETFC